jgi:hypothetical protein
MVNNRAILQNEDIDIGPGPIIIANADQVLPDKSMDALMDPLKK